MNILGWRGLAAGSAVVACMIMAGAALAGAALVGSVYFALDRDEIICDALGTETCTVELAWSVSNADKFDEWKLCWKKRESSTWLDDHCNYHSKIRKIQFNSYAIPNLAIGQDYRVKLEGRRRSNGNWTCVHKTMIRGIGHSAWLDNGGVCGDF